MTIAVRERTVWICRHGNRIDFVDSGWRQRHGHDPHLSEDGVVQAQETGRYLAEHEHDVGAIFTSPFLRCVETAHHMAVEAPIFVEPGLGEWLNASWFSQMPNIMEIETLAGRFPGIVADYEPVRVPEFPETAETAFNRAAETAAQLVERHPGNLLLVGHGHSVIGMCQGLLGMRPEFNVALCALTRFVYRDGQWRMELANDTSHLSNGETGSGRLY